MVVRYEDLLAETVSITVTYREGRSIQIGYRPDRYTDTMHLKLRELREAPDFSPLDPLLVELVGEWSIMQAVRDQNGREMSTDGTPYVAPDRQQLALEMRPITTATVSGLPCFMKMAIADAIVDDIMRSAGNAKGTSGITPAAGDSPAPVVPASTTPEPSTSPQPSPITAGRPALVTVPPLA